MLEYVKNLVEVSLVHLVLFSKQDLEDRDLVDSRSVSFHDHDGIVALIRTHHFKLD